jgi:hypothetical protein
MVLLTMASITIEEKNTFEKFIKNPVSKLYVLSLRDRVLAKPSLIPVLYEFMFSSDKQIQWRSAWVLDHVHDEQAELVNPLLPKMVRDFPKFTNDGVKRHIAKILSLSNLGKLANGDLINTSFEWLMKEQTPIAVKVHCMQILYNICDTYPDLKPELRLVIEELLPNQSAGFKSRAKKLLQYL